MEAPKTVSLSERVHQVRLMQPSQEKTRALIELPATQRLFTKTQFEHLHYRGVKPQRH